MNNTNNIDSQVSLRSKSKYFKLPEANHESLHKIKTPFDKQQKSLNIEETAVIPPIKQSYSQVNASTSQDTSIPTTNSTDHPRNNLSPVIHRSACRKAIPYTSNDLFKAITKCQTSSSLSVTPTPIINVKSNPRPPPPPPCIMYAARQLQDVASPQAVALAPYISSQMSTVQSIMSTQMTSQMSNTTSMIHRVFTQLPNPHHLPDGHGASQVDD